MAKFLVRDQVGAGTSYACMHAQVWATQLSAAAVAAHFPDGQLMARWGEPMAVVAGDFIAAPCPGANTRERATFDAHAQRHLGKVPRARAGRLGKVPHARPLSLW
eukprot:4462806-Pleurochrysis_carterae.AAC.1